MSGDEFAAQSTVYRAAMRAAESPLSDDQARVELRAAIAAHTEGIEPAVFLLNQGRDGYTRDRAFRLLSAAASDGPVEPMPADSAELFEQERELGQIPVGQAFARLKQLEPALAEIEREVVAGRLTPGSEHGFSAMEIPLGRSVAHSEPLLRSDLALNIAVLYLEVRAGLDRSSDLDTPYFSAARRRGISTGVLLNTPFSCGLARRGFTEPA